MIVAVGMSSCSSGLYALFSFYRAGSPDEQELIPTGDHFSNPDDS